MPHNPQPLQPFVMPRLHCKRCNKKWIPRKDKAMPKKCPKCSSPYWHKARGRNAA